MRADWKKIETAPKDGTKIMATDGQNIEPVTWNPSISYQYLDEPVLDRWGEETNYGPRGGWEMNGLTSDENEREMLATYWDYMPELPTP